MVEEIQYLENKNYRKAESAVGWKQNFFVGGACMFPRPSVVVKCNQLYSGVRNIRTCFCDFVLHCRTVLHRSSKSRCFLQTKEFMSNDNVTQFCFSAVACALLHICSFVCHPSLRTAQRTIFALDVVSEHIRFWHGFSLVVIASVAILLLC